MPIDPMSSLVELSACLAEGRCSAVQLVETYLERIARADAKLHAYVTVDAEGAREAAARSDRRRAKGRALGPLDGVPIAVKDLCEIEGEVTTCGSAAWRARRSRATADAVLRLNEAGMAVLGKTHMVEFAFGLWGTNPLMGTPWNPWDLATHRVPGGSSSGSAVAVAAGLAPAAIGSDTGGSVRVPAALNGLTGLKTTHGLIGLRHTLALSPTLDSIGPLCRSVTDAALLTEVLCTSERRPRLVAALAPDADLRGVRVIAPREQDLPERVEPEVRRVYGETRRAFGSMGVEMLERELPFDFAEVARRCATLIAAEAWRVHRAYAEDTALAIGPWVRQRVLAGKSVDDAALAAAVADHRARSRAWREWLADADALLTPATPIVACPVAAVDEAVSPLATFSRAGNYLGACALAFPAGLSAQQLPIGMQLMAKPFDEEKLARLGSAFQRATDWHRRAPDTGALFREDEVP